MAVAYVVAVLDLGGVPMTSLDPAPGDKSALRRCLQARRRDLSAADRRDAAEVIARALGAQIPPEALVAGYAPVTGEPDVWPFLHHHGSQRGNGGQVYLPITPEVAGDRTLRWGSWSPGDTLTTHPRLPLSEPDPRAGAVLGTSDLYAHAVATKRPLVVLVPCLAVDPSGFRLGQGGGYYDSAWGPQAVGWAPQSSPAGGSLTDLKSHDPQQGSLRLIGVVYSREILSPGSFQAEGHDLRLSEIVSEDGFLRL